MAFDLDQYLAKEFGRGYSRAIPVMLGAFALALPLFTIWATANAFGADWANDKIVWLSFTPFLIPELMLIGSWFGQDREDGTMTPCFWLICFSPVAEIGMTAIAGTIFAMGISIAHSVLVVAWNIAKQVF